MIERLKICRLKGLREVELPLGRLNLLIGPNGAGKTSLLEGLNWATQMARIRMSHVFSGPRSPVLLATRGTDGPIIISTVLRKGLEFGFVNFMVPRVDGWAVDRDLEVHLHWQDAEFRFSGSSWVLNENRVAIDNPALRALGSSVLLRFDPMRLRMASLVAESEEFAPDGSGLATFIARLIHRRDPALRQIEDDLRKIVPNFRQLAVEDVTVRQERAQVVGMNRTGAIEYVNAPGYQLVFDFDGAEAVPASLVSDGTMLALGYLASMKMKSRAKLILIDELERGLHPKAMKTLVAQLRAFIVSDPQLQIVATTHSPYLVDEFSAEEVFLTNLDATSSVQVARLDAHPDFAKWKSEFRSGEFWSMVGEKWVTEGAATRVQ